MEGRVAQFRLSREPAATARSRLAAGVTPHTTDRQCILLPEAYQIGFLATRRACALNSIAILVKSLVGVGLDLRHLGPILSPPCGLGPFLGDAPQSALQPMP